MTTNPDKPVFHADCEEVETAFPASGEITRWCIVQTPTKRRATASSETPVIENVPYLPREAVMHVFAGVE